ncbi:hypothetical protein ABFS82_04G192200 [Erythranthe guttata]
MEEKNRFSDVEYPPGIRFHPSDEELISYYLHRKVNYLPLPPNVITDIHLYSYNPWDLPRKALFAGEEEWYFFTPRDRKYPNGGRPNRTAVSGYWKATGIDKPILNSTGSRKIGVKKTLVFYKGKPPNGIKMNWIMIEYRLPHTCPSKGSMRLDDWVLCRVRQKGNKSKNIIAQEDEPPSLCRENRRDMLADYLLSTEYHIIASLLIGHDPGLLTIPGTIREQIITSENINTEENFSLLESFSDSVQTTSLSGKTVATMDTNSYCQHTNMKELDIPALLSDNFL